MKLRRNTHIVGVMTPFPHSISHDATPRAAAEQMQQESFHHLPVMKEGILIGILEERDLILGERLQQSFPELGPLRVEDLCSRNPLIVEDKALLGDVCALIDGHSSDAALVVRDGKLVGIFTSHDAVRLLHEVIGDSGGDIPDQIA